MAKKDKKDDSPKLRKAPKEINGAVYAGITGLNNRDKFFIKKKYKAEKKTVEEWKKTLIADGLSIPEKTKKK